MKRLRFALLLVALCPLMSGCQDREHSVVSINSYGDGNPFVEVNVSSLKMIIDSKQDLVLEVYSPTCSACEDFEPILKKYCQKQNKVVYRLNTRWMTEDNYREELQEPYPDIFHSDYVPTLSFISDGKLTYEVSSNKFGSYTAFKSVMNKHFISSKITMVNDSSSFADYKNNTKNYLCYFYDYLSDYSLRYANEYIITNDVAKKNIPVLLIDLRNLDSMDFKAIQQYYNTDSLRYACMVKDNEIKKAIDYSFDDGISISELVSSF